MECTYQNKDGVKQCLGESEKKPFLRIAQADCVNEGDNGIITAKVTMKICNDNSEPDYIFRPKVKRNGEELTKLDILNKSQYDFDDGFDLKSQDPIYPGTCKTITGKQKINVCMRKSFPLLVTMNGNMQKSLRVQESWCYAHIFRKNRIVRFDDNVISDKAFYAPDGGLVVTETATEDQCKVKVSWTWNMIFRHQQNCSSLTSIRNFLCLITIDDNEMYFQTPRGG